MATNARLDKLEISLNDVFVKKAPALPRNGVNVLVQIAPWASLIIGVFTLLGAWGMWNWARAVGSFNQYVSQICSTNSAGQNCGVAEASRFSLWVWLAIIFLLVEGILYLLAYRGLRDHKKEGWNYLFYGALVNVVYAVVSLFAAYDPAFRFISAVIGSAIGFYLLFQIRSRYLGRSAGSPKPPVTPPSDTAQ